MSYTEIGWACYVATADSGFVKTASTVTACKMSQFMHRSGVLSTMQLRFLEQSQLLPS